MDLNLTDAAFAATNGMTSNTFIEKAKDIVYNYTRVNVGTDKVPSTFGRDDIYVVWFAKTLQHWKAMVSTSVPDGMYYEVTHNGDKKETYLDVYTKTDNVVVHD